MDESYAAVQDAIQLARSAILEFLDPGKVRVCPGCGHEVAYAPEKWFTAYDVKVAARADLDVEGAAMDLALYQLGDEGFLETRPEDLKIRLRVSSSQNGG